MSQKELSQITRYVGWLTTSGLVFLALSVLDPVASLAANSSRSHCARSYAITEVGSLGGKYTHATALNRRGEAIGTSRLAGTGDVLAPMRAFIGRRQVREIEIPGAIFSSATAANSSGAVAGIWSPANGVTHAFLYSGGQIVLLEDGALGGELRPVALSDSGVMVLNGKEGVYVHDTRLRSAHPKFLAELRGATAMDANESGLIVGYREIGKGVIRAFSFQAGRVTDIGTLGGTRSVARAVNDRGEIVGWSEIGSSQRTHAFLISNDVMQDLGTLGSWDSAATAISDSGDVVGYVRSRDGRERAVVFCNNKVLDLNALHPSTKSRLLLSRAVGVNAVGEILVEATDARNPKVPKFVRAVIMTPMYQ
jgi:probable HAF family extracellular repeat protein